MGKVDFTVRQRIPTLPIAHQNVVDLTVALTRRPLGAHTYRVALWSARDHLTSDQRHCAD
jgi:hypothetical protein